MTETHIEHIGVIRRSGRYPWGSGDNPQQRTKDFLGTVDQLRKQGMSDVEIAEGLGITTTQLRARRSIARNEKRKADAAEAFRLREEGMSNVAIGRQMGINESVVRSLLNPAIQMRTDELTTTANLLKDQLAEKGYLDVGAGVENHLGISGTKLKTALAMLEDEGYVVTKVQVEQLGTGKKTTIRVLAPEGTTYRDIVSDPSKIKSITAYSEDGGSSFSIIEPPRSVDSKRVAVRYAEDGGAEMDGVIQLRRGVDDISLGNARYAQVRIAVDGTHYLKGMAMYADDLPDGVDLVFNTSKSNTGNPLDAMKPVKSDSESPFGSIIRQKHYIDKDGKKQLSVLNIVGTEDPDGVKMPGEEGAWSTWSKKLSSQMLSKQSPTLAKEQLGMTYAAKKAEFEEIMSLTNPAVRKKLLESFADDADSSAVHLKAAGLPRTANHVILPINTLKDNEIFAPNYNNGEKVVLIRHPHGGTFEIPELTVNNRNREANAIIRQAKDAVGINSRVAAQLSGADFDGDTVLVIPNNARKVRTSPPLAQLKDFDAKAQYPKYDGMKVMTPKGKQHAMGDISNLITDMTIKGATHAEIARAVRHSMVVIDAEKHQLNYKQSALDHNIRELKAKYQGGPRSGAATLVSRASSDVRVPERRPRPASKGGPVDPATGKKMWEETGNSWVDAKGRTVVRKIHSTRMAEADDARDLISTSPGTAIERIYAEHANNLKSLANAARKSALETRPIPYSPSAKQAYAREVAALDAKLALAFRNKPLERQAQLLANAQYQLKRQADPNMDADTEKKVRSQALITSRARTGAQRQRITLTPSEWEAIQAGAISNHKLTDILANADLDQIKQLATPRTNTVMNPTALARAKSMHASGYTAAEIASALGVATSTLSDALSREEG